MAILSLGTDFFVPGQTEEDWEYFAIALIGGVFQATWSVDSR
jgi:hypothetical protein